MWAAGHANDVPVGDGVATVTALIEAGGWGELKNGAFILLCPENGAFLSR